MEEELKKNLVFLQARIDSKRLPRKVLQHINGRAMIDLQIERIQQAKLIQGVVVLIPDTVENDELHTHLLKIGIPTFRGSLNNVYERYLHASKVHPSHSIIRLTADCPLVMPKLIDQMIGRFELGDIDYLSNSLIETFPDGLDIEIVKSSALEALSRMNINENEKEHVTLGIYQRPNTFKIENFQNEINLGDHRWTVDYEEDFSFITRVFNYFKGKVSSFEMADVLKFIENHPEVKNTRTSDYRNISLKKSE